MEQDNKDTVTLSTPLDEVTNRILVEQDVDQLQNIINIFNLNMKKKDILRTSRLSDLQDKISTQIEERLVKHAGEFSNKDLLDYFKVIQDTIDKSDTTLQSIDTPAIQINQNQLNVSISEDSELDRSSKYKVMKAVQAMLAQIQEPVTTEVEYEIVPEVNDEVI